MKFRLQADVTLTSCGLSPVGVGNLGLPVALTDACGS